MEAFWQYWDKSKEIHKVQKVELFRRSILEPYKEAFSAALGGGEGQNLDEYFSNSENLLKYLDSMASRESEIREATRAFPDRLFQRWARFSQKLPDLNPSATLCILPSPKDALGGCVRPVGNHNLVPLLARQSKPASFVAVSPRHGA